MYGLKTGFAWSRWLKGHIIKTAQAMVIKRPDQKMIISLSSALPFLETRYTE